MAGWLVGWVAGWLGGWRLVVSANLCACLPVCLFACLPVCRLVVSPNPYRVRPCLFEPVCLSACLPVCLFACLPVCLLFSFPSMLFSNFFCIVGGDLINVPSEYYPGSRERLVSG